MSHLEDERRTTRSEIGTYLRDFGDDFRLDGAARVEIGDEVIDANPPRDVEFAVRMDDEPADDGGERRRLTFELTWEKTEYDEDVRG